MKRHRLIIVDDEKDMRDLLEILPRKAGAYDYFIKPFNIDEVKLTIKKALELKRLERENRLLKDELKTRLGFSNIVGTSPRMAEVYSLIMSVAKTKTNVFITGRGGTGRGLAPGATP